jgi:hypothetical protein
MYRTGDSLSINLSIASDSASQTITVTVCNHDTAEVVETLLSESINFASTGVFQTINVPAWTCVGGKYDVRASIGSEAAAYGFIVDGGIFPSEGESIKSALYAFLSKAIPAGIYPQIIPADAGYPVIAFTKKDDPEDHDFSGVAGPHKAIFQIDCYARGADAYAQAETLAEQIRQLIGGYRGTWGKKTIQGAFIDGDTDDLELDPALIEQKISGVSFDVKIFYS